MEQNPDELKALLEQKRALDEKIGRLSQDPDHPVLKPATPFSEGEEVTITLDGESLRGKVLAVTGDAASGWSFRVGVAAEHTVPAEALSRQ